MDLKELASRERATFVLDELTKVKAVITQNKTISSDCVEKNNKLMWIYWMCVITSALLSHEAWKLNTALCSVTHTEKLIGCGNSMFQKAKQR